MLPSRWESFSGKQIILDLTHMFFRITRGPMQMERFRGMRFSRWRFSPIWRVELTGIARTSKILMKLDQSCFWKDVSREHWTDTRVSWARRTAWSASTTPEWCLPYLTNYKLAPGESNIPWDLFCQQRRHWPWPAFQREVVFAVQRADQLREGGAGDVRHPWQVPEGDH